MSDLSLFKNNPTFRRNFLSICIAATHGVTLRDMKNIYYGNLSLQGIQKARHKLMKREKIINSRRAGKTFAALNEIKKEAESLK